MTAKSKCSGKKFLAGLLALVMVLGNLNGFTFVTEATDVTEQALTGNSLEVQTKQWDFQSEEQLADFSLYRSAADAFSIQNERLTPTGAEGELKAILEEGYRNYQSVSVDIYPGVGGTINGGLYFGASNASDASIDALAILVESDFVAAEGQEWEDAPNRLDLIIASFPVWTEHYRLVSETGAGNALFSEGNKEGVNLKVDIAGKTLTVRVSLISNPEKYIETVYEYTGDYDLKKGRVGIRSESDDNAFDNFSITYEGLVSKEPTYAFENVSERDDFSFYNSDVDSFYIADGFLKSTGSTGELKAILEADKRIYNSVSVDIYPGANGTINSGLYVGAKNASNAVDGINGLTVMVQSNFVAEPGQDWADAPNRIDLIVGSYPKWQELHRTISETGAGNALFSNGVKEGLNLKVDISGKKLTIRLSLISDPFKYIETQYEYAGNYNLETRYVGIRSGFEDDYFDNLNVEYTKKATHMFHDATELQSFALYQSEADSFAVQNGQLVPTGNAGELKAIIEKGKREYQSLSVDIYPGEDGTINGGLYVGASKAANAADSINALGILVESTFTEGDEANRVDLIIGSFPTWKELHRTVSTTGKRNVLFTNGEKAPLNLKVDISGNTLVITLSRIDKPETSLEVVYEYGGTYNLETGYVGIRSRHSNNRFDNLDLEYTLDQSDKVVEPATNEPWRSITKKLFRTYRSEGNNFVIDEKGEFVRDAIGLKLAEYKGVVAENYAATVDVTAIDRKTNATILIKASGASGIQSNTTNPSDVVTGYGLYVEGNNEESNPDRLDIYMCKFVDGEFAGYIVPEGLTIDRYVCEGDRAILTDAGDNYSLTLNFEVVGNKVKARAYRTDDPEKATAIVTFDLAKATTTSESTLLDGEGLMLRSNQFAKGTVFKNFVYYGTNQDFGFFDDGYNTQVEGQTTFVKAQDTYYADGKGYKRYTDTKETLPENYQVEAVMTLGENGVTRSGFILNATDNGNGIDNFAGYFVNVEKKADFDANRLDLVVHYNGLKSGSYTWIGEMGRLVDEGADTLMSSMPTDGRAVKIRLVASVYQGILEVYAENYYDASEKTNTLRINLAANTYTYPLLSGGNLSLVNAAENQQGVVFEDVSVLDLDKKVRIENADFEGSETDLSTLGYIGNTAMSYITLDAANSGNRSLYVAAYSGNMYLPINVKENTEYTLRFFTKSEHAGDGCLVGITNGTYYGATALVTDFAVSNSADWKANVVTFNSGSNTEVYLKITSGSGISYIDDITIAVPMDANFDSTIEGSVSYFNQYYQMSTEDKFVTLYGDTITAVAKPKAVYDFAGWFDGTSFTGRKAAKTICLKEKIDLQAVFMYDGLGDLDFSGWIENEDHTIMRRVLVGSQTEHYDKKAADINADEKYSVVDLIALKKRAADVEATENEVVATPYLVNGAIYKIVSTEGNGVLQAESYTMTDELHVTTGTDEGELNQRWKAIEQKDGTYLFKNMAVDDRYLTMGDGVYFDTSKAENSAGLGDNVSQRWILNQTSGSYQLVSKLNGNILNVGGNTSQNWTFELVSNGTEETPILLPVDGYTEHSSTPEIIKVDDTYYMFLMQPGIRMKKSTDLIHWEDAGWALPEGKNPAWIEETYGDQYIIFAPSITKMGDTYYLYYAASKSGNPRSSIGLATSKTMEPGSFVDQGRILYSQRDSSNTDMYNCIDPHLYVEGNKGYLVFGSWVRGVGVVEVDYNTGRIPGTTGAVALKDIEDTLVTKIANTVADTDKTNRVGVEAGYLIKKGNYYYLFLARGTYSGTPDQYCNIVSRSTSITGLFKDAEGRSMLDGDIEGGAGTIVSETKSGIIKPAHASVFQDTDGNDYFVTEYLNTGMPSQLAISTIIWSDAEDANGDGDYGWPTTALTPNVLN